MQLSVIIVNFNVKYFLEQCLHSVIKACDGLEVEILVVDNNSSDGSREYLSSIFPGVKFFWQGENQGFGRANNFALTRACGDYILFLNPDTIVPEDCFRICLRFFEKTPACGALGVHMVDGSGCFLKESKRMLPSPMASLYKMTGFARLFPSSKKFAAYYCGHLPEKQINEVDVLAGAFMMISREMATTTKGFDEDFFMYAEDVDLSYRIQKAGKKNYYFPGTTIIHFKGESTSRLSQAYVEHFYGAMLLFVRKHYQHRMMMSRFTSLAIRISKMAAQLKLSFQRAVSPKSKSVPTLNVVLVCSQAVFSEKIDILKYSRVPYILLGRISITEDDAGNNIGSISNLKELVESKGINAVIFCEGLLTNRKTIETLQALPRKLFPMFHASESKSIVGSNRKTGNGFVISTG